VSTPFGQPISIRIGAKLYDVTVVGKRGRGEWPRAIDLPPLKWATGYEKRLVQVGLAHWMTNSQSARQPALQRALRDLQ
jgi:hypothetical protein